MSAEPITLDSRVDSNDPAFYPFKPGHDYIAKSSFTKGSSQFESGMRLRFQSSGYSWYDNAFAYEFVNLETKESHTWWLWANESSDLWLTFFAEV